jgi:hypothetical protein
VLLVVVWLPTTVLLDFNTSQLGAQRGDQGASAAGKAYEPACG